jgi:cell division control protein 6
MQEKGLVDFFVKYLDQKSVFRNRDTLQSHYIPSTILHREKQQNELAKILAPSLKGQVPSNVFIFGKTGTGKTLLTQKIVNDLAVVAKSCPVPVLPIYINCKMKKVADTQYRLIAHITREHFNTNLPFTGLPTEEIYAAFIRAIDTRKQIILLVLDEFDQLIDKEGDDLLYNLTRLNTELKHARIAIIGISNNLSFTHILDQRVKSSLTQEQILFPQYNAVQLQDILKNRAAEAFAADSCGQDVIAKCAAFAARDHGDARKAINLLRVAGELAERSGATKVGVQHLDEAEEKIETDSIFEVVKSQPMQYQTALYAIYSICSKKQGPIFTGEVYELYQALCERVGLRPLTQRRISDIVADLEFQGIIKMKVISKGRYGRTREISLSTDPDITPQVIKTLADELSLPAHHEP